MAKRKSGGGAATVIGGGAALVCAVLALSGNFDAVMGDVTEDFPAASSDETPGAGDEDSSADGATVTDEDEVEAAIPSSVTAPAPARTRDLLSGLDSASRVKGNNSTYDRDAYGEAWRDVDGNGCSQRQDVLHVWLVEDEPSEVRAKDSCSREVFAGTWHDPYTGRSITLSDAKDQTQARLVQIDHIVPLKEAHNSGAAKWSSDRKLQFANDTTNLVPVYGPANESKSDKDAAAWRPRKEHQCDYARRYTAVKAKWNLTVDDSERNALSEMLDTCD